MKAAYTGRRDDVLAMISDEVERVLDVGCSDGTLGAQIRKATGAEVTGIELDSDMAAEARRWIDEVICEDIESVDFNSLGTFDCIVFADVLEHLKDPWTVLRRSLYALRDDGVVIASIPNVGHWTTIAGLTLGQWPHRSRGIHDKSHLRFFTLSGIHDLFKSAGLEITEVRRNHRIVESPHRINSLAKYLHFFIFREFLTFQYLENRG